MDTQLLPSSSLQLGLTGIMGDVPPDVPEQVLRVWAAVIAYYEASKTLKPPTQDDLLTYMDPPVDKRTLQRWLSPKERPEWQHYWGSIWPPRRGQPPPWVPRATSGEGIDGRCPECGAERVAGDDQVVTAHEVGELRRMRLSHQHLLDGGGRVAELATDVDSGKVYVELAVSTVAPSRMRTIAASASIGSSGARGTLEAS